MLNQALLVATATTTTPNDIVQIVVVAIIVAIVVGCGVYSFAKKTAGQSASQSMLALITKTNELVKELYDIFNQMDDISKENFDNDEMYRKKMIDLAVTTIENYLERYNITVNISKEALVEIASNIVEIAIDKIEEKKAIEAKINIDELADISPGKDISGDIENYYQ